MQEKNIVEPDGSIVYGTRGASSAKYWYRQDVRGSITNIVNNNDTVKKSYTYDAYGNTGESGTLTNSIAYTGAIKDDETGLYYMNARYYDPTTGRFISQDSYRGDGERFWHLYAYCNGDPVNFTDPTGHTPMKLAISNAAVKLLKAKGYTIAAAMFYHALWGKGKSLPAKVRNSLTQKLKKSNDVKTAIKRQLRKYKKNVIMAHSQIYTSVNFKSGDLHYAVGKASIKFAGQKNSGSWNLRVTVYDTYNFEEIRTLKNGASLSNLANDLGTVLQKIGWVVPYKWSSEYSLNKMTV